MNNLPQSPISQLKMVIESGQLQDNPQPNFISKLGTEVYSNLIFNKYKPSPELEAKETWEDFIIEDALMSVSQSKKIVETEIPGMDGVIVEYIGLDAFEIQITGRLTGSYNVNPKEETNQLSKILSAKHPLDVTSWYLQNLDIVSVVVKDFVFNQTEGEYSTQYFTINAQSDQIVEATISNNK
ncbi:MAG: hypothetical protein H7096_01360 [Flavobacterium sp.]|nr:hypothetical protein [Pedobacter sp.]